MRWREAPSPIGVLLFLLGLAVYANSLSGAFVIDDRASIVHNETIREWWRIGEVLRTAPDSPVAGRPIANLTFALNYALGELDVRGYHAFNILLHLTSVLLAFGVVRRTLELPSQPESVRAGATRLSFAVALIWCVHPLNTEVVTYLSQRTESLAAVFLLGTLYAAIRAATDADTSRWRVLAVIASALGMASKELVALAPVLVALYDRVYLFDSWREAYRRRKRLYWGLAATWLVLALLLVTGARSASVGFSLGVSPWVYLLNQARMITRYLRLAIWPDSLVAFYGWPQPLTLGDVLPEAGLIVGLLGLTVYALVRFPELGYPGAWFFLLLAPTSSILPITTEVGAERRMYLPLLALVTLVVLGVFALLRWSLSLSGIEASRRRRIGQALGAALVLVVCVGLGWGTVTRNREYRTERALAQTLVQRWPTGIAYQILGNSFVREGDFTEGIAHLQQAVDLGNSRAGSFLGLALYENDQLDAAIEQLEAFLATVNRRLVPRWLEPPAHEVLPARVTLAEAYCRRGRWSDAEEHARRALRAAPADAHARIVLADALFAQQRWQEAAGEYRDYLRRDPDNADAWINLGIASVTAGDPGAAREAFERAVAVAPRNVQAHQFLAMILVQVGDPAGAARHAREALDLGVEDPTLREILAEAQR